MGYGNLLYQAGRAEEAAVMFRDVIAYHSDYAPAWNNLAQILIDEGDKVQARANVLHAILLGGPFIETYRATLLKIDEAE